MKLHTNKKLILFSVPALAFYLIFMIAPSIGGLFYSFTDWNALNPNYKFIWFNNFIEAFKDQYFVGSIKITVLYVIVMVIVMNVAGLLIATLIDSRKKQGLYRTIFFMPNMVSLITSSFIWVFIFSKVFPELAKIIIFKYLNQSWFGDPRFSFWAIVIVALWSGVGYTTIIYLAALQNVDTSYKEAAAIDGASKIQTFFHVTLPLITNAIGINIFLTLNGSFKAFDHIFGLTGGGPGRSTQVIALNIYEEAFSSNFRFGYANAKAVILFLFVLIITLIQFKITSGGGISRGKKNK